MAYVKTHFKISVLNVFYRQKKKRTIQSSQHQPDTQNSTIILQQHQLGIPSSSQQQMDATLLPQHQGHIANRASHQMMTDLEPIFNNENLNALSTDLGNALRVASGKDNLISYDN